MSKQPLPAPIASAIGPCPTIIQIVGSPNTGSLPRTIAPPDHQPPLPPPPPPPPQRTGRSLILQGDYFSLVSLKIDPRQ